jgi:hypothetical protein
LGGKDIDVRTYSDFPTAFFVMPRSSPQLPADFLANILKQPFMKGFVSVTQISAFEETRFALTDMDHSQTADDPVAIMEGPAWAMPDTRRTHLHLAAMVGDLILVCEMIRLGASVNKADASGKTSFPGCREYGAVQDGFGYGRKSIFYW